MMRRSEKALQPKAKGYCQWSVGQWGHELGCMRLWYCDRLDSRCQWPTAWCEITAIWNFSAKLCGCWDDRQIRRNGQPLTTQSHHHTKEISGSLTLSRLKPRLTEVIEQRLQALLSLYLWSFNAFSSEYMYTCQLWAFKFAKIADQR